MIPEPRRLALRLFAALAFIAVAIGGCSGEPKVSIGGPFQLIDQNGQPQDQRLLRGKWSAVFFGYTFCPDVCPTTLQTLAEAKDRLGPRGERLQVVFITVDPERDTPAQLKTYLSSSAFPKGTIGLTGSPAQVAAAGKAYHAFFQKEGSGPDYAMQHVSAVYLMDPKGRFNRVVAFGLSPDDIARQITEAMRAG